VLRFFVLPAKLSREELMKRLFISTLLIVIFIASTATAAEFSADMIMEMPFGNESGKVYHKSSDLSRTEMMGMINIMKYPLVYQLFEETGKYVVTDVDELSKDNPAANIRNFEQFAKENNFKKVGTENFQGYKCDIYEGEVLIGTGMEEAQESIFMKFWYSKDLDFPLRTESSLPPPTGGMVVSYLENISKGNQPASLFEIPPGYVQAQSISEAMGVGSILSVPKGLGQMPSGDEMPSQEEMDEMMKMMREMMEHMTTQ
jgi:hypothetical protein